MLFRISVFGFQRRENKKRALQIITTSISTPVVYLKNSLASKPSCLKKPLKRRPLLSRSRRQVKDLDRRESAELNTNNQAQEKEILMRARLLVLLTIAQCHDNEVCGTRVQTGRVPLAKPWNPAWIRQRFPRSFTRLVSQFSRQPCLYSE